jgi:hypothetical protein
MTRSDSNKMIEKQEETKEELLLDDTTTKIGFPDQQFYDSPRIDNSRPKSNEEEHVRLPYVSPMMQNKMEEVRNNKNEIPHDTNIQEKEKE